MTKYEGKKYLGSEYPRSGLKSISTEERKKQKEKERQREERNNCLWPALGEKKSPNDVSEARMSGNILSHISPEVQKHKQ